MCLDLDQEFTLEKCCNTWQHPATHCNTLHHSATHCTTLQHAATYCNTRLQPFKVPQPVSSGLRRHCNTRQYTATHYQTHCNTVQHINTHCNTLCNTLQHAATRCNTPLQPSKVPQPVSSGANKLCFDACCICVSMCVSV